MNLDLNTFVNTVHHSNTIGGQNFHGKGLPNIFIVELLLSIYYQTNFLSRCLRTVLTGNLLHINLKH